MKQTQHRLQVVVQRLQSLTENDNKKLSSSRKRTSLEADLSPIDVEAKRAKMMEFLDMKDNSSNSGNSGNSGDSGISIQPISIQPSQSPDSISNEYDALSDNSHATGVTTELSAHEQNWSDTEYDASSIIARLSLLRELKQLAEFKKLPKSYVNLLEPRISPNQSHIKKNIKQIKVMPREFTVEKILAFARNKSTPFFYIKWKGYDESENTWEPLHHIVDCQEYDDFAAARIAEYHSEIEYILKECIDKANEMEPLSDADGFNFVGKFNANLFETDLITLVGEKRKTKITEEFMARTVNHIRHLPFYTKRVVQQHQMVEWEAQINAVDKSSKLTVENDVDFELPPMDFTYINDVLPTDGLIIPDEPPIGCECPPDTETGKSSCSPSTKCCGKLFGSEMAYTRYKTLRVPQGTPIYECNKRCKCGPDCNNRVVQQGRKHSLRIFKTSNGCGWGVRTDERIKKGEFLCEYVGEVISYEEAEKRGKVYDAEGRTYLFDLDFNSNDNPYSIDAAKFGNVSHFINHSCDPNLGVWAVWINCLDMDLPKICLFALKTIEAGEEITFDYKNQYGGDQIDEPSQRLDWTPCRCGAANCRKFLF